MKINIGTLSVVILFLTTVIPFGSSLQAQRKTFKFDGNTAEGYVAFVTNESVTNQEDSVIVKCECHGKKVIIHGDGHKTPCLCLNGSGSCSCKSDKNEVASVNKRKFILYFTASWCGPCQSFKKNELPKLKDAGLKSGILKDGVGTEIEIVDVDENKEYYSLWKKDTEFIPFFVLIDVDGVEYARLEGYQTKEQIMEIWNANK